MLNSINSANRATIGCFHLIHVSNTGGTPKLALAISWDLRDRSLDIGVRAELFTARCFRGFEGSEFASAGVNAFRNARRAHPAYFRVLFSVARVVRSEVSVSDGDQSLASPPTSSPSTRIWP